jgi:hypothetical protein
VEVGETWWSFDPRMGAQTNGGSPRIQHGSQIDGAMLDPARLVPSCDFQVLGRTLHAGRAAIRVKSQPRTRAAFISESGAFMGDWPQELLVDAERGVLLRLVSLIDDEPFVITEFFDIAFDEELEDDLFVFVPPPGEELHDAGERSEGLRRDCTLDEAARRAPFGVFVPGSVPGDWRMRVHYNDADERRGWRASVNIHYSDDMARVNININEQAIGSESLSRTAPDGGAWRIEPLAIGELRLWEPSEAERGMPRLALLDLEGTRIQISTSDLSPQAIAELAGSLRTAPTEPPALN